MNKSISYLFLIENKIIKLYDVLNINVLLFYLFMSKLMQNLPLILILEKLSSIYDNCCQSMWNKIPLPNKNR